MVRSDKTLVTKISSKTFPHCVIYLQMSNREEDPSFSIIFFFGGGLEDVEKWAVTEVLVAHRTV